MPGLSDLMTGLAGAGNQPVLKSGSVYQSKVAIEPNPNDFLGFKIIEATNDSGPNWMQLKDWAKGGSVESVGVANEWYAGSAIGQAVKKRLQGMGYLVDDVGNEPYYTSNVKQPGRWVHYIPYKTYYGAGERGTWGQQAKYTQVVISMDQEAYESAMKEYEKIAYDIAQKDKVVAEQRVTEENRAKLAAQRAELERQREIQRFERENKQFEIDKKKFESETKQLETLADKENHKMIYGMYPRPTIEITVEPTEIAKLMKIPMHLAMQFGLIQPAVYSDEYSSQASPAHPGQKYAGFGIWESLYPNVKYPTKIGPVVFWDGRSIKPVNEQMLSQLDRQVPGIRGYVMQIVTSIPDLP